jgi:hypothetical protein
VSQTLSECSWFHWMALIITVATQKHRSSVIMALLYFLFVCCGVVLALDVVCGSKVVKAIG